jgi:hypothetical protein
VASRFVSNGLILSSDVHDTACRTMAEDVRRMADRIRDPDGKRIMLEIADSYDKLAVWAVKTDAADADC